MRPGTLHERSASKMLSVVSGPRWCALRAKRPQCVRIPCTMIDVLSKITEQFAALRDFSIPARTFGKVAALLQRWRLAYQLQAGCTMAHLRLQQSRQRNLI